MKIVWVVGEALMDLIPVNGERVPMVGGGPANTAKAVARLGYTAQFIGASFYQPLAGVLEYNKCVH